MIGAPLKRLVRQRAGNRCEYCRIRQEDDPTFRFHVEHVVATKHGGSDDESNLALACQHCNLHKGANISGVDDSTGNITTLFHPRSDSWNHHFELEGSLVIGKTAVGRATVRVLAMNDPDRLELRSLLK